MNIILLHGDNEREVSNRLKKFIDVAKKRSWEILRYNKTKDTTLPEMLVSTGLFERGKLVLVEDINALKKADFDWIKKSNDLVDANLVIYNTKLLSKSAINKLPGNVKIEEYKIPVKIWQFLDAFAKENTLECLKLFQETLQKEPVEFIFAVLAKHIRNMLLIQISQENLNMPAWRKKKLEKQAVTFEKGELFDLLNKLSEMDIRAKTSRADLTSEVSSLIVFAL